MVAAAFVRSTAAYPPRAFLWGVPSVGFSAESRPEILFAREGELLPGRAVFVEGFNDDHGTEASAIAIAGGPWWDGSAHRS